MKNRRRSLRDIEADLAGALRYQQAYQGHTTDDYVIALQRRDNDEEIVALLAERAAVLAAPELRGGESTGAS